MGSIVRRGLVLLNMHNLGDVNSWGGGHIQWTVWGPKYFKIIAIRS